MMMKDANSDSARRRFWELVDTVPQPLIVANAEGRVLRVNPAGLTMMRHHPERAALLEKVREICKEVVLEPGRYAWQIDAQEHTWEAMLVRLGELPEATSSHDPSLLVYLGEEPPQLCDEALQRRYGLTPAHIRVVRELVLMRTNREIARQLGISIHTVRRHVERILMKMRLHGRKDVRRRVLMLEEPRQEAQISRPG